MRPVEDTLNLHDLVVRVPLRRVDAAVLVYGLDANFVRTEDIVAIEQQRDESGIDLSPPEQRIAQMYFELDRIEISSAIREAALLVATTPEEAHRLWFEVAMVRLADEWPDDERGLVLIATLLDHFLMHDEFMHLWYMAPRPSWSRRVSAAELAAKFREAVRPMRARLQG
ncbi:hypothetical protein [Microbacterium sp. ZW T5_56]|uniref:hypothetical protein n=1 Tax=Microbacterium sp. ZW T5_56 TaxID=3378081 RepID=UPI0038518FD0